MTITIQNVLDKLMAPVANRPESTVDTLKSGHPDTIVKGIATTFMATHEVIRQAVDRGANLLITHEGTFYSHQDRTDFLTNSPVYEEKQRLIAESGIAIFRYHDYVHRYRPDAIMMGLLDELGWQSYVAEHKPASTTLNVPAKTVQEIVDEVKSKLHVPFVRAVGDLTAACSRVGILVGYRGGGTLTVPLMEEENLDLIIYGEGPEWETPEYVRDAVYQGRRRAAVVLGHAESEQTGMKYLAAQLKMMFPDLPVQHIPSKPLFKLV